MELTVPSPFQRKPFCGNDSRFSQLYEGFVAVIPGRNWVDSSEFSLSFGA